MRVTVIETPDLGDRSYVVSDDTCAVVIDPQRDLDRVQAVLAGLGVPAVLVLETHLHNDYVTGGLALSLATGAEYVVAARDEVAFPRRGVREGDELIAGTLTVRVVETPGHTDTHVSYVVGDGTGPDVVFSGGSLLYGSVGRTDLLGTDRTDELTRKQWHSARRLADLLDDDVALYPTHGFGSFCSSGGASGGTDSTIGRERQRNDALTTADEQDFVDTLVAGLTGYPTYYAHMGPRNAAGPTAPDLTPPSAVDPEELARRLRDGQWVLDLRDRTAYARSHLMGSVSIELGPQFSTYVGWVVPWGAPLTLLGQTPEQVSEAQRQLVRIGVDELAGATSGPLGELAEGVELRTYPRVAFTDVATADVLGDPAAVLLDVRRDDERARGFVAGSQHVPLSELPERIGELSAERVFVHCGSGFRAAIAASLLDRAEVHVVHVDDDFAAAEKAGLTVTRHEENA